MRYYIFKDTIYKLDFSNSSYEPSYNFDDRFTDYVALNDLQTEFYLNHLNASMSEIWYMQENKNSTSINNSSSLSASELRQNAYKEEADQYLIAYQGYMAEGDNIKAEEQLQLYLIKKNEIRQRYKEPENEE